MKPGLTHIEILLDKSGSMQSVAVDTIGGMNSFLSKQKEVPGEVELSLVQFNNTYLTTLVDLPLNEFTPLNNSSYRPSGFTALLDALGRSIDELGRRLNKRPESERPEKVLFVVLTDGYENASKEYSRQAIKEKITHQREKYSWEFIFLGANQDAILTGAELGIGAGNSLTYAASAQGLDAVYNTSLDTAVKKYRSSSGVCGQSLFTEEDRDTQNALDAYRSSLGAVDNAIATTK
jgi:hypothetical protein